MKCEYCDLEHSGGYGSGRFCTASCARGFSTKAKRKEINKKVSDKMIHLQRQQPEKFGFNLTPEQELFRLARYKEYCNNIPFNELGWDSKRKRIIVEQENKCNHCSISEWHGHKLSLEIDHINGINDDNRRENLEGLCPNCHSVTETW